jgi:hypothetical protein
MRWLVKGIAVVGLTVGLGACRQGLGERCQIDSDCQEGLICSQAGTFPTCRQPSANLPDSGVADGPLASHPDATVAHPDARPATIDAGPTADASTRD